MHNEKLTLATSCDGAVQEKVNRALEKAVKNILDPNMDPMKKRVLTLKITMKPNEDDNEDVYVTAEVNLTLAPEQGVATRFFINKNLQNDHVTILEHKKGEIKGQLDFSDLGMIEPGETREIPAVNIRDGEPPEKEQKQMVVDLRKKKA